MLHDTLGQQTVEAFRPCVVKATSFIESHRGGRLNILAALDDSASDEALAAATNDDELEAAIKDLPPAPTKAKGGDPLDHDGDGRKGGSKPRTTRSE